ncbi:MAG: CDP-glycerol glycerophosphotransferase family protein [Parcubacteria group bacterium]|nr:CDP-glycerol glycerophosphotransferase family protein [Parcubacteria group bacterium]
MKTIFITAFHPFISKNILNTDVFKILKARNDLKIILLVPVILKDFFENNYRSDNVIVEGVDLMPFKNSSSNNFFSKVAFFFIYNHWIRHKRHEYLSAHPSFYNFVKFHVFMVLTWFLSGYKVINKTFRFFDWHFSPGSFYENQFEKYKPDIIFSTDVYDDFDQALIKEAKIRKVFVVGMVRSWDNNISKGLMRCLPDRLIVNNEVIKKEAIKIHNFPEENIFIGGLPQFDDYLKAPFKSREEFFKSVGGDPDKMTILFSPGSREISADANIVICEAFKTAKERGILPKDVQFFVRNHPTRPDKVLEKFKNDPDFIVEMPGTMKGSGKFLEFSMQDSIHLIDTVYYSDVVVWIVTSIGLDSLVFDKPQIAVDFDGFKSKPYWSSVKSMNDYDHLISFFKTSKVKRAGSIEDLILWIGEYLKNPRLGEEGRKKAAREQLWKVDGKSGARIADFILSFIF